MSNRLSFVTSTLLCLSVLIPLLATAQQEPGRLVSIGEVALQINCTGSGSPTVVIETGLEEFSFDWALVQQRVARFARVCTYDRGGYASSGLADVPRTFGQLTLELHTLLRAAREKPPFVLVGHSFGGPVVRNYAALYPEEVAGMVLAESVTEHQPLILGGKPRLLKESATNRSIPQPRLAASKPQEGAERPLEDLPKLYGVLPRELQALHRQFAARRTLDEAEQSQKDWSSEYFAEWDRHPQQGLLAAKPLLVLTRAVSGYDKSPDYSLDQVDGQRLRAQTELLALSRNSLQWVVPYGHNLHLEAPGLVAAAIRDVVRSSRSQTPLASLP